MNRLYTLGYNETRLRRILELELCRHCNDAAFDYVCTVPEGSSRQTFQQMFELSQESGMNDVCVIANSDVFFTRRALLQIGVSLTADQCYCLTRWDLHPEIKLYDVNCSQDAWVFRGPPRLNVACDFPLGGARPGCDNKIAYELRAAGYTVLNPSKSIKMYHAHAIEKHDRVSAHEGNRLPRPYLGIHPHELGEEPRYVERL